MDGQITRRLELRLVGVVGAGLLLFSGFCGLLTYHLTYREELAQAALRQEQLVRTIQAQAEVAAFAANERIAQGVLEGLLANPALLAARIESSDGFALSLAPHGSARFGGGQVYPLFSPVDSVEPIGRLILLRNDAQVEQIAATTAWRQTAWLLAQLLAAATLLVIASRSLLVQPIVRLARAMFAIRPGSSARLPVDPAHATDEIGLLSRSANAILDAAERAIREVTDQRNELERLATHDHLTGLPTLRLADDRLQVACSNARRTGRKVALLFVDLDGFKEINDLHGHDVGDEVLREVARRLRASIREEDTAARIGGDEFMILLGNLPDAAAAGPVAGNLCRCLAFPFVIEGRRLCLGASIGIAVYPDHTGSVDAMRHLADQAMYAAKRAGKGRFVFAAPGGGASG